MQKDEGYSLYLKIFGELAGINSAVPKADMFGVIIVYLDEG